MAGLLYGQPRIYPVQITHTGTTVTIDSDPFRVIATATHNTTGIFDITFNTKVISGSNPVIVGTSQSNIVVHVISPTTTGCSINTKLTSTGTNFTAAGPIYLMIARAE